MAGLAAAFLPGVAAEYAADGSVWRTAALTNVQIAAGTALDLSSLTAGHVAGEWGRACPAADGSMVFERRRNEKQRLIGSVHSFWDAWALFRGRSRAECHEGIDRLAEQVKRQGFNLMRLHGTMDETFDELKRPILFDAEREDFYDYLFYALKRNGVYVHTDLAAFGLRAANADDHFSLRQKDAVMFGDPFWTNAYRQCATAILDHVNPYTGLAWKDDPALLGVMAYNEQATGAKIEEQRRGWSRCGNHAALTERFITNALWQAGIARQTGYRGIWSCYNSDFDLGASAARWLAADAVCYNIHYDHPDSRLGVRQVSSIDQTCMLGYDFGCCSRMRLADRPLFITEYSHSFPNRYRYEAAALTPAYAALNGYSAIMWCHAATLLSATGRRIEPMRVATSPLMRAAAFLSVCLFRRGDVREAPHLVVTAYSNAWWRMHSAEIGLSDQAKIALLTRYGVVFPELNSAASGATVRPDVVIPPFGGDEMIDGVWHSTVAKRTTPTPFSLDGFVERLRRQRILPKDNRTNPAKGVFESETGELLADGPAKSFQIVTPLTEAFCSLGVTERHRLDCLEIVRQSEPGCLAVTSVDGRVLRTSRRMVLLWMTREANTGMKTEDGDREVVQSGDTPGLLKTGCVAGVLHTARRGNLKLYMLDYSGERLEQIPVKRRGNDFSFIVDTARTVHAPTPFFELVDEPEGAGDEER